MAKEFIDKILEKLSISSGKTWPVFPGVIPWWRLRASEQIK
jgi:hypothetical protein